MKGYNHIILTNEDQIKVIVTSAVNKNKEKTPEVIMKQKNQGPDLAKIPIFDRPDSDSHELSQRLFSPLEPVSSSQTVSPLIGLDVEQVSPTDIPEKGYHSDLSPMATVIKDDVPFTCPDE